MKLAALLFVIALCGCNEVRSYAEAPVERVIDYAHVRSAVFEPFGCIKCHGTVADYSVETRDAAIKSSKLCEYLEKGYMPPRGDRPSAELTKMVCDWISAGAP